MVVVVLAEVGESPWSAPLRPGMVSAMGRSTTAIRMTHGQRFLHERLDAYHVAMELFIGVEEFAAALPRGHADLKDQVRRAAAAVVRNIAEGANRESSRDKAARFSIALGECGECAAALHMAAEIGLRPSLRLRRLADRVAAMCTGLVKRQRGSSAQGWGSSVLSVSR